MPKPVKAAATSKNEKKAGARLGRDQAIPQLVAAATALLADKGPAEIKARTVAEAAGMSTIAVYHHLGGLPELFNAIIEQGFKDLGDAFLDAPASDDPVTSLFAMALAARRFARASPHLYDLMFGLSTRGSYRPLDNAKFPGRGRADNFEKAYAHLVQACTRLVDSGRVRVDEDPEVIAPQLWSAVHGFVTLELGDHFEQFDDPVRQVLQPMMVNVVVGLGDDPQAAVISHGAAVDAVHRVGGSPT